MTPNQLNRNTRDSVVSLLTQAGFSEDSSVINQLEGMNFDEPAEPTQPQSDAVSVPRELLVRIERYFSGFTCDDPVDVALGDGGISKLRALLGGDQPAQPGSAKGGSDDKGLK